MQPTPQYIDLQPYQVVVHDGMFHADDCLAYATVLQAAGDPGLRRCPGVFRRRLQSTDSVAGLQPVLVLDTGGRYDGQTFFDHHQVGFKEQHPDGIPMSAFGLIWRHLGFQAVRETLINAPDWPHPPSDELVRQVLTKMQPFVSCMDAHDNGVLDNRSPRDTLGAGAMLEQLTLPAMVAACNSTPFLDTDAPNDFGAGQLRRFHVATDLCSRTLRNLILRKASRIMSAAYVEEQDRGDEVLVLDQYVEWGAAATRRKHIQFVVHPGTGESSWVVNCTKNQNSQYHTPENARSTMPASFWGLSGAELAAVSQVEDAQFCHKNGHVATAGSKAGALALAQCALRTKTTKTT